MEIVSLRESSGSPLVRELRHLLENQWDQFAPFDGEQSGITIPAPMLAVRDGELLGGLVFSLWPSPETGDLCIWINGLIVKPEYRGKGIAKALIAAAMHDHTLLFVITDIERLYSSIGWSVVSSSERGVVLRHEQQVQKKGSEPN